MQDLYLAATADLGVRELPGDADNPEIMQYYRDCGHSWVSSEDMPWCSAAMNAWCRRLGYASTGSLRARSWLDLPGAKVIDRIEDLRIGDITILWRSKRDGPLGHVASFGALRDNRLHLLGGNQSNSVCSKPYMAYRFLSGRRLTTRGKPTA